MRTYLRELHTKPDHHKKRFSLLVSGCFTLLIFAIWSTAKFGTDDSTKVADALRDNSVTAVSPLESIRASAEDGFRLLTGELDKAKDGLKTIEVDYYGNINNQ